MFLLSEERIIRRKRKGCGKRTGQETQELERKGENFQLINPRQRRSGVNFQPGQEKIGKKKHHL